MFHLTRSPDSISVLIYDGSGNYKVTITLSVPLISSIDCLKHFMLIGGCPLGSATEWTETEWSTKSVFILRPSGVYPEGLFDFINF